MTETTHPLRLEAPMATDDDLFRSFAEDGDSAALETLLERNWNSAYQIAFYFTRETSAAEDVAQEACLKLLRAAQGGRSIRDFTRWFRGTVANEARMYHRSHKRRARHESQAARSQPAAPTAGDPLRALSELTAALDEAQRRALELHYGLGLSHAEIAELFDCSKGTISSRIRAGVARLRQAFSSRGITMSMASLALLYAREAEGITAAAPPPPSAAALISRAAITATAGAKLGSLIAISAGALAALSLSAALLWPRAEAPERALALPDARAEAPPRRSPAPPGEAPPPAKTPSDPAEGPPARELEAPPRRLGAPSRAIGAPIPRHPGHTKMLLSRDGRRLFSISPYRVQVWDTKTLSLIPDATAPGGRGMTLLPDGEGLAIHQDKNLLLLDPESRAEPRKIPLPERAFSKGFIAAAPGGVLACGSDGPLLFVGDEEQRPAPWRVGFLVYDAAFSPDGAILITADFQDPTRPAEELFSPPTLSAWDVHERRLLWSVKTRGGDQSSGFVSALAFSSDGRRLVFIADRRLRVLDPASGDELQALKLGGAASALALVDDERAAAVGYKSGAIQLLGLADRSLRSLPPAHHGAVRSLVSDGEGRSLISGGADGTIRRWDLDALAPRDATEGHIRSVHAIRVSPDGQLFATSDYQHQIILWDAKGQKIRVIDTAAGDFAFRDDATLAVNGFSGLQLWDIRSGRPIGEPHRSSKRGFAPSTCDLRGRRWLARITPKILPPDRPAPRRKLIFDLDTEEVLFRFPEDLFAGYPMALSPDGTLLAWIEDEFPGYEAIIFDVITGREVSRLLHGPRNPKRKPKPPEYSTRCGAWRNAASTQENRGAAFSPDARTLYINEKGSLAAWDLKSGKLRWRRDRLRRLAVSADGERLAAIEAEGQRSATLIVLEEDEPRTEPGRVLTILDRQGRVLRRGEAPAVITAVAFLPGDGGLVVGLEDGRVLIYP